MFNKIFGRKAKFVIVCSVFPISAYIIRFKQKEEIRTLRNNVNLNDISFTKSKEISDSHLYANEESKKNLSVNEFIEEKYSYFSSRKGELIKVKKQVLRDIQRKIDSLQLKEIPYDTEIQIINSKLSELREGLKQRKFTSEDIVTTFTKRTIKYGRDNGWITDVNFSEALEIAKKYDIEIDNAIKNNTFDSLPLLYGIPFSVKDHIKVKGLKSTLGMIHLATNDDDIDSDIISILRQNGGIPFVKTTMPILGMSIHGHTNMWHDSLNPWNKNKTSGGSTSGEGGLIASGCSPFGVGSDAAGSLRIPATFCGISSLLPSKGRLSMFDVEGFLTEDRCLTNTPFNINLGIMAKFSEDIEFVHRVLNSEETHKKNKYIDYVPWNTNLVQSKEKLKIGYFLNDEVFEPCETTKRAILESVKTLSQKGHEIVELKMNQKLTNSILITFWRYLLLDQGKLLNVLIDKENFDVYYTSYFLKLHKKNKFTISIQKFLLEFFGQNRMTLQFVSELKGSEVAEESINIFKFREIFLKKLNELELDAVICPVMPFPAPDIIDDKNEMLLGSAALSYTILFNFLNMPCGVVPITLVKENELAYRDIKYRDWIRAYIAKTIKNSLNMPVGIQVASYHNRDEVVLRIMNEIQSDSSFPYKKILEEFK